MNNLFGIIAVSIYIIVLFFISKFLNKKGEEISRKFLHIFLCNIWLFYMALVDSLVWATILPIIFIFINSLSYKFKLIKSMERENNDGFGTIYYAISILIVVIISYSKNNLLIGMPGILIMGYGDGLAAIIGQKVKSKEYKIGNSTKTIAGSLTMFIVSFVVLIISLSLFGTEYLILKALGIAFVSTILEAISIKGLDNITVPVIITILMLFV